MEHNPQTHIPVEFAAGPAAQAHWDRIKHRIHIPAGDVAEAEPQLRHAPGDLGDVGVHV